ncbi:MAG: hypothetical protein E7549_00515 [Ruminococcaceae bacterium]|nr:hypothetical protein [Oscillospiraceae bacterium]
MNERKVRWQTAGARSIIACVQTGRHFVVIEENRETGEVSRISETFSAEEAWNAYNDTIALRVARNLRANEAPPAPEDGMFRMAKGEPYVTNLQHPVIAGLMEDYRRGNGIPHGDQLSDRQRQEFDRMVVEYLYIEVPKEILNSMLK